MASLRSIITDSKYGKLVSETEKKTKLMRTVMYDNQEYTYILLTEWLIGVYSSNLKTMIGYIDFDESSKTCKIEGIGDRYYDNYYIVIITAMWKCITS